MVAARKRMVGDMSTFQLIRRYCKSAPALLKNFVSFFQSSLGSCKTLECVLNFTTQPPDALAHVCACVRVRVCLLKSKFDSNSDVK